MEEYHNYLKNIVNLLYSSKKIYSFINLFYFLKKKDLEKEQKEALEEIEKNIKYSIEYNINNKNFSEEDKQIHGQKIEIFLKKLLPQTVFYLLDNRFFF